MKLSHYADFANLFIYPDYKFPKFVSLIISKISSKKFNGLYVNATKELQIFYKFLPVNNVSAMEEIYTRSFDVQSATTLDIGYVLFSDDYKRGELLVHLNKEYKKLNFNCGSELGDYLPNILCLISSHSDKLFLFELVQELLVPALCKMIQEFDVSRVKKRNEFYKTYYKTLIDDKNVALYSYALKSLYYTLISDFNIKDMNYNVNISDFLVNVQREFKTEREYK
jgi:nitrate reductase assembly molybdenum cofactor insertion protein NarJ